MNVKVPMTAMVTVPVRTLLVHINAIAMLVFPEMEETAQTSTSASIQTRVIEMQIALTQLDPIFVYVVKGTQEMAHNAMMKMNALLGATTANNQPVKTHPVRTSANVHHGSI